MNFGDALKEQLARLAKSVERAISAHALPNTRAMNERIAHIVLSRRKAGKRCTVAQVAAEIVHKREVRLLRRQLRKVNLYVIDGGG